MMKEIHHPPAETYHWGVQAIDNSYDGSLFAEGNFSIDENGTLPVTIEDYKAVIEGNNAVVKWKSLTETNVNKYILERSKDGKVFTTPERRYAFCVSPHYASTNYRYFN